MAYLVGLLDENSKEFKGKSHKQIMYERVLEKHG
jgi:hypothetical protein